MPSGPYSITEDIYCGQMGEGDRVEFCCCNLIKIHQDSSRRMIMIEFVHNSAVLGDATPRQAMACHAKSEHAGHTKPCHAILCYAIICYVICVVM